MQPRALLLCIPLAIATVAPMVHAQDVVAEEPVDPKRDTRTRFFQAELGIRTAFIRDAGYDPYSSNDGLTQVSLAVSRTLLVQRDMSFAAGVRWDWGGSSDRARGAPSSLFVHRLGIPLEARYHLTRYLYGFARVAPSLMSVSATVHDDATGLDLSGHQWVFAGDVSLGAAVLLGPHSSPSSHLARWWATVDGGYGWAPSKTLELAADTNADGPRYGAIAMRPIAMRGGFFRIGVALSL